MICKGERPQLTSYLAPVGNETKLQGTRPSAMMVKKFCFDSNQAMSISNWPNVLTFGRQNQNVTAYRCQESNRGLGVGAFSAPSNRVFGPHRGKFGKTTAPLNKINSTRISSRVPCVTSNRTGKPSCDDISPGMTKDIIDAAVRVMHQGNAIEQAVALNSRQLPFPQTPSGLTRRQDPIKRQNTPLPVHSFASFSSVTKDNTHVRKAFYASFLALHHQRQSKVLQKMVGSHAA